MKPIVRMAYLMVEAIRNFDVVISGGKKSERLFRDSVCVADLSGLAVATSPARQGVTFRTIGKIVHITC